MTSRPRRLMRTMRRWAAIATSSAMVCGLITAQATAQPSQPPGRPDPKSPVASAGLASELRDTTLGSGWQHAGDLAWTTSGDADGLHVLVARADDGYVWRTAATLSEPGFDTDSWIGNACVTASGKRAVVVYAPRTYTNNEQLTERGGFTAAVDLESGAVTKIPTRSSLAYYSPGCGPDESAVVTQEGGDALAKTRLVRVDASDGTTSKPIEVPGQLTSAVPARQGIVAADSGALVSVSDTGERRVLTATSGVAFKLTADSDGGVVYLEQSDKDHAAVKRITQKNSTTIAQGKLAALDVTAGRGGRVFITGSPESKVTSQAGVALVQVPPGSRVSTEGRAAITAVDTDTSSGTRTLSMKSLTTGQPFTLRASTDRANMVNPALAEAGSAPRTASPKRARTQATDPHNPADFAERYCSVPRGDPRNQAMQPKPRQVEWAVDQAVRQVLTVQRPANWKNLGMPAYTPQGLFPSIPLVGGGTVPPQIMLGIAAQESNLWQAARSAVPGVTGNPLVGNYYGIDYYNGNEADDWSINWAKADCGYGVTQVTDGMRLSGHEKPGETALPYNTQRAVALDFATNIAAGLRLIEEKWNQTRQAGLTVNNGDAAKIENWFFAIWAYNSGFHPNTGGPWGLGWLNNPANPRYPANRKAFLDSTYTDAAHPQDWPYPEKVIGWAGHPIQAIETPGHLVSGYNYAWWNDAASRTAAQPPPTQFCDTSNNCEPGTKHVPNDPDVVGEPAGPCAHTNASGQYDLKCWYHQANTWKADCSFSCGNEQLRFDPGYAYQDDATSYPPNCTLTGIPDSALIIDDVPDNVPSVRPNCGRPWTNAGTFTFNYKQDANGNSPGKVDTHQIGGGFGGHFWFTHTRTAVDNYGMLEVTGSWRLNQTRNGPMKVLIALPDHGAQTSLATYTVKTARGDRQRTVRQAGNGNRWVSLGTFMFNGTPEVTLTSVTNDGTGTDDIAFDAAAFVPVNGNFHEESVEADAVFDEDQNIDTAANSWLAGPIADRQHLYDWAIRSADAILAMPPCNSSIGDCLTPQVAKAVQNWRNQVVAAGTDPVNHPDGNSIARWIGFANSHADRPTSDQRPGSFDDDGRYKIKTKATVSFVTDSAGKVIPDSQWAVYENRTGDTHLPGFAIDFMRAVSQDYAPMNIAAPDLTYRMTNLNLHDGSWTTANPMKDGVLPGRAYAYSGKAPALTNYAGNSTDSDADCVAALTTAGGSIGYRPMLSQNGPTRAMQNFSDQIAKTQGVARPVSALVNDIRGMFFATGVPPAGSMFNEAAPIWQELNFRACADGTIRKVSNRPILRASWMPDQYLYHNGAAMSLEGGFSKSSAPVITGDFQKFSALPDPNQDYPLWPNPFGPCDAATDRSGNPWDISVDVPPAPGADPPHAHFCLDRNLAIDPPYSS